jgi:hypothetical protein
MNIDDLNRSISNMSDEELEKRLINIRKIILIKKNKPVKKISKNSKISKSSPSAKSLFSSMSQAEKEALILELETE